MNRLIKSMDPLEWKGLAKDPRHAVVKSELAKWLPKVNAQLRW